MARKKKNVVIMRETISELCHEVNKFDKEFGVNLKKINPYGEPEVVFDAYVMAFQEFLVGIIYEINGISTKDYMTKKHHVREIKQDFTEVSILRWNTDDKFDVDSFMFRCRFLTSFLLTYLEKIDKIAIRKYDYLSKFKTGKYENGYFYMQKIAEDTRRFIRVMLSGNSYGNIMLQMNQNCSYMKTKKQNPKELNKFIRDIRYELKKGLKENILVDKELPDDVAIDSILKLAYLVSTGDTDLKGALPKFRYIEGADTTYELRGLIEALGSAIMETRKYEKRPLIYSAYMKAEPEIMSKYKDINENWFCQLE